MEALQREKIKGEGKVLAITDGTTQGSNVVVAGGAGPAANDPQAE